MLSIEKSRCTERKRQASCPYVRFLIFYFCAPGHNGLPFLLFDRSTRLYTFINHPSQAQLPPSPPKTRPAQAVVVEDVLFHFTFLFPLVSHLSRFFTHAHPLIMCSRPVQSIGPQNTFPRYTMPPWLSTFPYETEQRGGTWLIVSVKSFIVSSKSAVRRRVTFSGNGWVGHNDDDRVV